MANLQLIPNGFKQTGDICLLASYSYILGYYKKLAEGVGADVPTYDVCEAYYKYNMELLKNDNICQTYIDSIQIGHGCLMGINNQPKDNNTYECFISRILHFYCQKIKNDRLRGYDHIKEFDYYLLQKGNQIRPVNYKIEKCLTGNNHIQNAFQEIERHLCISEHNLAMLIFLSPCGGHSVVVAKDTNNDVILFRDPNYSVVTKNASIINTEFSNQLVITEYMLFSQV